MNFRAYNLDSGEVVHWHSGGTVPGGGRGWSLPAPGSGVRDEGGGEIFSGDIVRLHQELYLVKFRESGFCLDGLTVDGRLWMHDLCGHKNSEVAEGVVVVGNSKTDSQWLAATILNNTTAKTRRNGGVPTGEGGADGPVPQSE